MEELTLEKLLKMIEERPNTTPTIDDEIERYYISIIDSNDFLEKYRDIEHRIYCYNNQEKQFLSSMCGYSCYASCWDGENCRIERYRKEKTIEITKEEAEEFFKISNSKWYI